MIDWTDGFQYDCGCVVYVDGDKDLCVDHLVKLQKDRARHCRCGHQKFEHDDHWGPGCKRGLPRRMVDPYQPCPCKQFKEK